jgi:hypothetical protein
VTAKQAVVVISQRLLLRLMAGSVFVGRGGGLLDFVTFATDYETWPCYKLRRLVAGPSPRRLGFAPTSVCVEFVVDKEGLGRETCGPKKDEKHLMRLASD